MKLHPVLRLPVLAALSALIAAPSFAQEGGYGYGGLSVGSARAKVDEERIAANLLGAGLVTTGFARDQRDTAYKVFLGYQVNRNIGIEAGYFDLGKFGFSASTSPAGSLNSQLEVQGFNLDVVGTLPITERLSAIGRVGAHHTRTRSSFNGTGALGTLDQQQSKRDVNAKIGAGLQYAFSPGFQMRGEIERFRINDGANGKGDVNLVSVSLVFPFGRTTTTAPRAMSTPTYSAPIAQAPMPAPAPAPAPVVVMSPPPVAAPMVVAPAPQAPQRRRVSYSAESLFGFDRAQMQPNGMSALDGFARELDGTQFETINVEGHTDRLGSDSYNQSLSQQRAESVKSYLVTNGKVDPGKISAVGKSESDPVTKAGDCKGERASASLIACLQPDRRVEIEVVGTR
ncbi:OmpA family protein [Ideonella sp. A 288]|uniref:OmpA family protein n=1 Tax=Ideonella sp. A 288 TaxID=1962181 RepID=UPI000B4ABFB1|nr:OmpA family protein [Ideonella sp. A 288]